MFQIYRKVHSVITNSGPKLQDFLMVTYLLILSTSRNSISLSIELCIGLSKWYHKYNESKNL